MEEIVEKKVRKTTKKTTAKAQEFLGTGRRKCSVARVRISVGTGKITINEQDINEYFELETLKTIVKQLKMLTLLLTSMVVEKLVKLVQFVMESQELLSNSDLNLDLNLKKLVL